MKFFHVRSLTVQFTVKECPKIMNLTSESCPGRIGRANNKLPVVERKVLDRKYPG